MKIGPCIICGSSAAGPFCEPHKERADIAFQDELTIVYCPAKNPDDGIECGFCPLEQEGFEQMFPSKAAKRLSPETPIVIVYEKEGCHRCAQDFRKTRARIYQLKPRASQGSADH